MTVRHGQTQPSIKSLSRRVQLFGLIRLRCARPEHSTEEIREWIIGMSSATVLIVVYTEKARASASSAQGLQLTSVGITKKVTEFPFASARCITVQEVATAERSGNNLALSCRNGKTHKDESERYEPVSIRLHSKVIEWAKEEAAERGIG